MILIDILVQDKAWLGHNDDDFFLKLAQKAISALPDDIIPNNPNELSLVLTDDMSIKELNRDYRDTDKPTNVLSFPTQNAMGLLGDVVLARETIEREASVAGKVFNDHLTHLILHGVLHLLGYDHIEEGEADEMEAIEIKALEKLGIANPYILRQI